jgi:anti-sigma regulatory factor (Ser/Thr protein kinase)
VSEVQLRVPSDVNAPEDARHQLSAVLRSVDPKLTIDVVLIVSGAVTNAALPITRNPCRMRNRVDLRVEPGVIRGEIRDGCLGFDDRLAVFDEHVACCPRTTVLRGRA